MAPFTDAVESWAASGATIARNESTYLLIDLYMDLPFRSVYTPPPSLDMLAL